MMEWIKKCERARVSHATAHPSDAHAHSVVSQVDCASTDASAVPKTARRVSTTRARLIRRCDRDSASLWTHTSCTCGGASTPFQPHPAPRPPPAPPSYDLCCRITA